MYRDWSVSDSIGCIYYHDEKEKNHFHPDKPGLYLCCNHSGDNFYDYVPLVLEGTMLRRSGSEVGFYGGGGKKVAVLSTKKEFYLLMADEPIQAGTYLSLIDNMKEIQNGNDDTGTN